ncbi:hypothetical protein [Natronobacterium gregoryi]|uniref:Uncharacterized protein n=2 Tax=Natronobacterium gregoryi TaxID=44930 RepID=L0AE62_NATGS|nr:hypothetical protein [Natronobacterium gregoryi]AFZ71350.1 hypothetical protein Natgr_0082 [Natronobacterium gregoryi SP2]ELY67005.1 hypothetical protein C490_11561 [Natronobacterium gregoryi SP2]PLK21270.1 hypothetical protein CYV19_05500 [Natronobacterium gregoryi SP2]SFI85764.1 hypothetical protein SAMN05443661_10788 [Natronobacterium gregoryi]
MSETETNTDAMGEVSHTNPYTGRTVGQLFSRGPTAVTDGGEPADAETNERSHGTMKDVAHTPPHDADDANSVFERGSEHADVGEE